MKKRKKMILVILSSVLVFLIVVSIFIGNYFTNYAVVRRDADIVDDLAPKSTLTATQEKNMLLNNDLVDKFHKEASKEEVIIESYDSLELWGEVFTHDEPTDLWAIVVHGYTSSHDYIQDIAANFYNKGYNVITPDLRGHGNSGGEYITLGGRDSKDVISWANYIISLNKNSKIVLHGTSMGASTVLMASGDETLPENVKVVIEDSGYSDAWTIFKEQLKYRFGLPSFPIMNIASLTIQIRAGYNPSSIIPIEQIQNSDLPILFMHGDSDTFVLPYMMDDLYNSYNGPKEKLVTKGADHVLARVTEPDVYYETIYNFIDKYID